MVVLQQRIANLFLVDLLVLRIVDGTPLRISICTGVAYVLIVSRVGMLVVFPNRIVVIGMDEVLAIGSLADAIEVVSGRNVTPMVPTLVGMVPLQGIEQAISMPYHGVHLSCTIVGRKVDLLFRIGDDLAMPFVGETRALQDGRTGVVPKKQKPAIFVRGCITAD